MKTLSYLNSIADTQLTFTDNRAPDVRFNSLDFRDIQIESTLNTFAAQHPVDIIEIIQPTLADVSYKIQMPVGIDVSLSWASIPAGVSIDRAGNTWTVSGIQTVAHWNAMKSPTVTLPIDYNGAFSYVSTIRYLRQEGYINRSWTVGYFVPTVKCIASFNQSALVTQFKGTTIFLSASLSNDSAILDDKVYLNSGNFQQFYSKNTTVGLTAPTIIAPYTDGIVYNIVVTPSNTALVTTISLISNPGITFNFNNTTKVATMSGSRENMIAALANLQITFAANAIDDFTITYTATTNNTALINNDIAVNSLLSTEYWGNFSQETYYSDSAFNTVKNAPLLTNNSLDPNNTFALSYTVDIEPTVGVSLDTVPYQTYSTIAQTFTKNDEDLVIAVSPTRSRIYYRNYISGPTQVNEYDLQTGQVTATFTPASDGSTTGPFSTGFGDSVVLSKQDNRMVIADSRWPEGADNFGALAIYSRTNGVWTLDQRIEAGAGTSRFGLGVDINENGTIIATTTTTQARIYSRSGTTWSQIGTISPSNGAGFFVSINDAGNRFAFQSSTLFSPINVYVYFISNYSPFVSSLQYTITLSSGQALRAITNDGRVFAGDKLYATNGSVEYQFDGNITWVSPDCNYVATQFAFYRFNTTWQAETIPPTDPILHISNDGSEISTRSGDKTLQVRTKAPFGKTWNSFLRRLTLVGPKALVNTMIQNLFMRITKGIPSISLSYTATIPTAIISTRSQSLSSIKETVNAGISSQINCNLTEVKLFASNISASANLISNIGLLKTTPISISSASTIAANGDRIYPFIRFHDRNRRWGNGAPPKDNYPITGSLSDASGSSTAVPQLIGPLSGRFFNCRLTVSGVATDTLYIDNFNARSNSIWLSEAADLSVAYTALNYNPLIQTVKFAVVGTSTATRSLRFEVFEFDFANPIANGDNGTKIFDATVSLTYVASF